MLSPMVGIGFTQADFVKSARALGIPSGMLVFSWDNLSNKGLIHEMPDRMFVWNDIQAHEARKLHKYPSDQIVMTGAPRFDEFFEMQPASTREEFCQMAGLDPARPIITYLGSSKFVAAAEQDVRHAVDLGAAAQQPIRLLPGAASSSVRTRLVKRAGMPKLGRPPVADVSARRRRYPGRSATSGRSS